MLSVAGTGHSTVPCPTASARFRRQKSIPVRNKFSTRPWLHLLEPLSGYLHQSAAGQGTRWLQALSASFNFGPGITSNRAVADLVQEVLKH